MQYHIFTHKQKKALAHLALALFLLLPVLSGRTAIGQTMIEPHTQAMPLLPFLDYLVDHSLGMDIEEAVGANGWHPLLPEKLPLEEGIVWLRFTIAPLAPDARAQTFLLDLGQSVPGVAALYDPVRNELSGAQEWRENLPSDRNILLLPEASTSAVPCYIRLEGLPGPWFAPMIRTPANAASNWSSLAHAASALALAVIMALCILRGASETGQWRYWLALFVAMSLLQIWLGMPALTGSFSLGEFAAILSPGLALMMLPHAGRHLMQVRRYSRSIDIQLFLLSLPGAVFAILPLIPGWDWLYRWLDLWPLGTLIFIPTGLAAWLAAIPGSRRFLLACLLPPLFTAIAWFGLDFGLPANILASGPAWGIFFAALILAASRSPETRAEKTEPAKQAAETRKQLPMPNLDQAQDEIINLEHPLDDPNLRFIPAGPEQKSPEQILPEPQPVPTAYVPPSPPEIPVPGCNELEQRENAMREPLDELMREGSNLEKYSLPPSARKNVEKLLDAGRRLSAILSNVHLPSAEKNQVRRTTSFNLQHILRNAHDTVAPHADYSGIALSWYMPPHLPQNYVGDAEGLEATLAMLMESSVRSAHHGAIKVSARRVPDSADPGHILFTVIDDGDGFPPLARSSLALAHAWELTGQYGGYLSLESSQQGTAIAFTVHFKPVHDDAGMAEDNEPRVILLGSKSDEMRKLSRIIDTLPCQLLTASTAAEALAAQEEAPVALLITTGKFSRPATADMARKFTRLARDKGQACHILAITPDEKEWSLLKASGFTHAMLEPVDPEILRNTVAELTSPGSAKNPAASPFYEQSATLGATDPIKSDEAPSMLIEQNFPIAQAFEGPDWLGQAEEEAQASERTVPDKPEAPEAATEWVGEPKPIVKPQAREEKPEEAQPIISHAPPDTVEWVGEPVPVPKQEPDEGKELLDFIVATKDRNAAKDDKPEEKEASSDATVKSFMEGSVNLVASALTGMLSREKKPEGAKPEQPEARPADDLQARSDPEIIGLLERMDAAMQNADRAYASRNCPAIAQATGAIAKDAEKFGLRLLVRMAKCVERAAVANDMTALSDLLPELGIAVERNRITLAARKKS